MNLQKWEYSVLKNSAKGLLTAEEKQGLIDFLKTLSDQDFIDEHSN